MIWLIPVIIRIFVADIFAKIIQKKLALSKSRERALFLQFFLCAILSWIIFIFYGADFTALAGKIYFITNYVPIFPIIIGIGFLNGFACYCQWRSQAISMSKSATMGIPDDIIALSLVLYVIPGLEIPFLTDGLIAGVALCFAAAIIFAIQKSKLMDNSKGVEYTGAKLVGWVLGYTVIWGVATFLFRFFAGGIELPWHNFLLVWYSSSAVSALIILAIAHLNGKSGPKISVKEKRNIVVLVLLIWSSLALFYAAVSLGPLTAIKPIFMISAMVGPILVGLIIFKEYEENSRLLKPIEKIAFVLGGIGVISIALMFPYHLL